MQLKKELKTLDISVDAKSALPVYEQIKQAIKLAIITGSLAVGDRLVPIRELATQLRVNANTIVKVYYQMELEGYLVGQPGSGYFVKGIPKENDLEKVELFQRITEEYLSKALKLGFSLEDMRAQLEKRLKETNASQPNPDPHNST